MKDVNLRFAVNSFCRRKPFRPFAVDLKMGDQTPRILGVRQDLVIVLDPKNGYRLFDCDSVWQVLDIAPG